MQLQQRELKELSSRRNTHKVKCNLQQKKCEVPNYVYSAMQLLQSSLFKRFKVKGVLTYYNTAVELERWSTRLVM